MKLALILTCEHAGNDVPREYASLFQGRRRLLRSHRGYDPGALDLARHLARYLKTPLLAATVTRLLVELNRSLHHRALFSDCVASLDSRARAKVLEQHYHPHRRKVLSAIQSAVARDATALHISVHTFTPRRNGQLRTADVGLLYDPARRGERNFCERWRKELLARRPALRVRRNYPYLGKADGLTTFLRRQFPARQYLGIELEVNQRWVPATAQWKNLQQIVAQSLAASLQASLA